MPALDVNIGDNTNSLVDNFAGQHYAFCYSNYSLEIKQLAEILKIKCVEI